MAEETRLVRQKAVRLFFAIWPDKEACMQLGQLTGRLASFCEGRKTKAENIHLTLVFVGEVDASQVDALCQAADEIEGHGVKAFDLVIERICVWKRKNIVYAEIGEIPQPLIDLVEALQSRLSLAGFSLEERPYKPHITLMRNASCKTLPDLAEPMVWRAREWVLVKSHRTSDGSVYTPIGRWSLEG
ncbi:MAG TPA: RNA 2',3'-cyclic phosphodiesterase [Nitrosospira sp.]|nr:RNA 2',3'-cyclic phosphodiesterase [Nitrosospira sp.]